MLGNMFCLIENLPILVHEQQEININLTVVEEEAKEMQDSSKSAQEDSKEANIYSKERLLDTIEERKESGLPINLN